MAHQEALAQAVADERVAQKKRLADTAHDARDSAAERRMSQQREVDVVAQEAEAARARARELEEELSLAGEAAALLASEMQEAQRRTETGHTEVLAERDAAHAVEMAEARRAAGQAQAEAVGKAVAAAVATKDNETVTALTRELHAQHGAATELRQFLDGQMGATQAELDSVVRARRERSPAKVQQPPAPAAAAPAAAAAPVSAQSMDVFMAAAPNRTVKAAPAPELAPASASALAAAPVDPWGTSEVLRPAVTASSRPKLERLDTDDTQAFEAAFDAGFAASPEGAPATTMAPPLPDLPEPATYVSPAAADKGTPGVPVTSPELSQAQRQAGWLWKKGSSSSGGSRKNWKRRWVRLLHYDDGQWWLEYHASEVGANISTDCVPRGMIKLTGSRIYRVNNDNDRSDTRASKYFQFDVASAPQTGSNESAARVLSFFAESEEAVGAWVSALREVSAERAATAAPRAGQPLARSAHRRKSKRGQPGAPLAAPPVSPGRRPSGSSSLSASINHQQDSAERRPSAGLSLSPPPASNGRRPSGTTPTAAAERRPSAGLSLSPPPESRGRRPSGADAVEIH